MVTVIAVTGGDIANMGEGAETITATIGSTVSLSIAIDTVIPTTTIRY